MADEVAHRGQQTKELPTQPKPPRITWKAVEPRHYARAQERKKESKAAYTDYVMRLVEAWDFADKDGANIPPGEGNYLNREQTGQVLTAFEARFGEVVG